MRLRAALRDAGVWPIPSGGLGRHLARTALNSGFIRLAGTVFAFATGVILTRTLGPSGYGVYALVMATAGTLMVCVKMGLPQLAVREVPVTIAKGRPDETKGVIYGFLSVVCLAGLAVLAGGFAWLRFVYDGDYAFAEAMGWGFVIVPFFAVTNIAASVLLGLNWPVLYLWFEIIAQPALFAFALAAAWAAGVILTPQTALAINASIGACVLAACLVTVWFLTPAKVLRAPQARLRPGSWAAPAAVMFATELVRVLEGTSGVFVVQAFYTTEAVGLYRVAEAVAGFMWLPLALLTTIVMPLAAKLTALADTARLQKLAAGSAVALVGCSLAAVAIIALAGQRLLVLAFGSQFADSYSVLLLFGVAVLVGAFFGTGAAILNMAGEERTVMRAFALGLAVKVGGALILVQLFGINGVPLAVIAAEVARGLVIRQRAKLRLGIDIAATALLLRNPAGRQS